MEIWFQSLQSCKRLKFNVYSKGSQVNKMSNYDFTWKIMMLGDADAEKTSLTIRYISGFFLENLKLTIGVDFYSKTTSYDDKKIKLQIWDFGGEERFRFLLHQYCKGANAAFFLYNITIPHTFEHLPDWVQIIREYAGDIPILLVGTNAHLQRQRAITKEQDFQAVRMYNLSGFLEVSALTGYNVEELFDNITELLFDRYRPQTVNKFVRISTNEWNRPFLRKSEEYFDSKSLLLKCLNWIVDKIRKIVKSIKYVIRTNLRG